MRCGVEFGLLFFDPFVRLCFIFRRLMPLRSCHRSTLFNLCLCTWQSRIETTEERREMSTEKILRELATLRQTLILHDHLNSSDTPLVHNFHADFLDGLPHLNQALLKGTLIEWDESLCFAERQTHFSAQPQKHKNHKPARYRAHNF